MGDILNRLQQESREELVYHNTRHTLDVLNAVRYLGSLEQVDVYSQILLETAAMMHETGIMSGYRGHEARAAKIAAEILPAYGYGIQDIAQVDRLIMVTHCIHNPKDILEKIICDADLDYLGRKDYRKLSELLRQEWVLMGEASYTDEEWIRFQIDFLSSHQYFSPAAIQYRDKGKALNINNLKSDLLHIPK